MSESNARTTLIHKRCGLSGKTNSLSRSALALAVAYTYTKVMTETLRLSRSQLAAFLTCQRRFQLRYVDRLPWPAPPLDEGKEAARVLGQRFHRILHRHFLGLSVTDELEREPELRRWWDRFVTQGPDLPPGRRFPELSLTVPIGRHLLTGRFDLLILGDNQAQIFDWKTDARPRTNAELHEAMQTRLYLGLAAEGAAALDDAIDPDKITLTYWYLTDPAAASTIRYDRKTHKENWAYLQGLVADLDRQIAIGEIMPLTDDLTECGRCAYQLYCGRQTNVVHLDEWEPEDTPSQLEPELP